MAVSKFFKNAILVGCIDWCCLVCEKLVRSEAEALEHIAEPAHQNNLENAPLFEKYKNDHILKVKLGYYCTYCNMTFSTAAKVTLHVAETSHKGNKGAELLTRVGDAVCYLDVLIHSDAWHGLTDGMCAICNVEFDDDIAHKKESTHIFNLVKNTVEFGPEKAIYRKIDETTFQCIPCNNLMPLDAQISHFEDPEHKKSLLKGENAYRDLKQQQAGQTNVKNENVNNLDIQHLNNNNKNSIKSLNTAVFLRSEQDDSEAVQLGIHATEDNKSKILESVTLFEKNEVNINFETETALCKKCLGNIGFNPKSIGEHIDQHKINPSKSDVGNVVYPCTVDLNNYAKRDVATTPTNRQILAIASTSNNDGVKTTIKSPTKPVVDENHNISEPPECSDIAQSERDAKSPAVDEDPMVFAKRNQITYNRGNNNAYCRVCGTNLPASLRSMMEHTAGNAHKKKAKVTETPPVSTSKPVNFRVLMEDYVDEVVTMQSILNLFNDSETVVNEKFCMSTLSFHLVSEVGNRFRCHVCVTSLTRYEFERHIKLNSHDRALKKTPVVTSFDTEFVREIRGLHHCGYCNLLEVSMDRLNTHMQSSEHQETKRSWLWRLRRNLPRIEAFKQERTRAIFMRLMFGRPFF